MPHRLTIHKIDQSCLFDLAWGDGQRLTASVTFPAGLLQLYQGWQRAYLGYYKQALRGRVGAAGQVTAAAVDWHSQLVQSEARLLSEFHTWLKQGDLYDLRQEVQAAAQGAGTVELFLTCTPLDLARLPWETWEFGPPVQIVRSPATIRAATGRRQTWRRGKARVLAILGDETGLNFSGERHTLDGQQRLMEIHYVGWQPGEDSTALKQRVCAAIADSQGWDVLFFAGHSNEAALVGGQIAIAPHTSLTVKDLAPYLQTAQGHGLQFALFNSCSGLDIAQGLINLGLSQVAIMREPIHNEVAQAFLVQLLQRLAQGQNVQEAMHRACQFLKAEQSLTYPSAYLVPSLFRHPASVPYRVEPVGWRSRLHRWRPTWYEALTVATLALVSLIPAYESWVPQAWLMDQRVGMQARYRELTGQVPSAPATPIVLVQVDGDSIIRWGATSYKPIDRSLLVAVITGLTQQGATVIGIDYVLDLAQPDHDAALNQALQQALIQNQSQLVFATARQRGVWLVPHPEVIAGNDLKMGDIQVPWWRVLPRRAASDRPAPFSYELTVAHYRHLQRQFGWASVPQLPRGGDLHPLTHFSYELGQQWLQPLLDLSIPPERVFEAVPAWQIWEDPTLLPDLPGAIVIVAPGGYHAAGLAADGEDNMPAPPAFAYWRVRTSLPADVITGGEAHAYMVHHLMSDHLVVPIPDVWLILVAAIGGKALTLYLQGRPYRPLYGVTALGAATVGYGLVSLQLYISGAVLLPWLLPSLTIWLYCLPILRENTE
ncbi:CHASE2 domain-containing protein [Nodosilinea sp. LEGE 07298]|uniref:CHASE2 domain-containing protein n=1 Tax=Nodosilinea sp. LEGE 07298 TaxID=2777970 RepID=UPI00187DDCCE|nr:CHASE2 domain-containing protein [Nodosilinea sp. LEGE 07298]MBE9110533.1 CHASE2 domain-containing protein [Nodosilinea sp. LEGE 07298]